MRISFTFHSEDNIVLSVSYQNIIQGFIYRYLNSEFATYLHSKGYQAKDSKRQFRLFTFSFIEAKRKIQYLKNIKSLLFPTEISFILSTVIEEIGISLIENQMKKDKIILGKNVVTLGGIKVHNPPKFNNPENIVMKSPLTISSTMEKFDGKPFRYFYTPDDKDFSDMVRNNLIRKYKAYDGTELDDEFTISPVDVRIQKVTYKGITIPGYMGIFRISGSKRLMQFAYDTGLGSRNSQGFGLFDIWRK